MSASRVNCYFLPTHQRRARGWIGRKCRFSRLRHYATGNRTRAKAFVARCQPTAVLSRLLK